MVARDDGLDARKCTLHIKQWPRRYEQVEQGSCADPGIFVWRVGGGGGGGVEAGRPENSLDNGFFLVINLFYRVDPMVLLQRGGGGPTSSRGWGVQSDPYNL